MMPPIAEVSKYNREDRRDTPRHQSMQQAIELDLVASEPRRDIAAGKQRDAAGQNPPDTGANAEARGAGCAAGR